MTARIRRPCPACQRSTWTRLEVDRRGALVPDPHVCRVTADAILTAG